MSGLGGETKKNALKRSFDSCPALGSCPKPMPVASKARSNLNASKALNRRDLGLAPNMKGIAPTCTFITLCWPPAAGNTPIPILSTSLKKKTGSSTSKTEKHLL